MPRMGSNRKFSSFSTPSRWAIIGLMFAVFAVLDFSTPSAYILAYLYTLPILLAVAYCSSQFSKLLIALGVCLTLLNIVMPVSHLTELPPVINRLLASASILMTAFTMMRYRHYQEALQAQRALLNSERQVSQMREDFIATLTHDLKTPLLGARSALSHFQDKQFGPVTGEQTDVLAAVLRGNARQLLLVEDLLATYKNDQQGVDLKMAPLDLDELIADALLEIQTLAQGRRIHLNYTCQRKPPLILGEASQLRRVLANLLHNALNYTPADGAIQVTLTEALQHLDVRIQDSGPGLPPDALEKIFHRFYRADSSREVVGTGLGLYLSRQLIQAHRGTLRAENVDTGGASFIFTLPIAVKGESAQ